MIFYDFDKLALFFEWKIGSAPTQRWEASERASNQESERVSERELLRDEEAEMLYAAAKST